MNSIETNSDKWLEIETEYFKYRTNHEGKSPAEIIMPLDYSAWLRKFYPAPSTKNTMLAAFIAGSKDNSGVRWVKISEKEPPKTTCVFAIIHITRDSTLNGYFLWDKEDKAFTVDGVRYPPTLYFIEWLDESNPSSIEKENQELRGQLEKSLLLYQHMTNAINKRDSENEQLRDALKELVALKDMKEKYESVSNVSHRDHNLLWEYTKRKPLAWDAARKLVK